MEGEFKVRTVEFEEKSAVEIEEKLLKEHEEKFNPKSEPQEQVNIAEVPEADIDENKIISYLGKRYNKEISSLDDIWEQRQVNEELPEDVSAFLKYKKETGRGINDFIYCAGFGSRPSTSAIRKKVRTLRPLQLSFCCRLDNCGNHNSCHLWR